MNDLGEIQTLAVTVGTLLSTGKAPDRRAAVVALEKMVRLTSTVLAVVHAQRSRG